MANIVNLIGGHGNHQVNTPSYFIYELKKLSWEFEILYEKGAGEHRIERIGAKFDELKVAVGTECPEHDLLKHIKIGFNCILELGAYPDHVKQEKYHQDFKKLITFFKRYNLTKKSVFDNFGTRMNIAADHLGVDMATLESYVTKVLKIECWPLGKGGMKVLVQVGRGLEPYVYAFDVKPRDGISVVKEKICSAFE